MTNFINLPEAAVENIIQRTRGHIIPGANKYARVCRQWREASSSSNDQAEGLQLFMDLHHMQQEELTRAADWMSMHGGAVSVLAMDASTSKAQQLQWFWQPAPALTRLKRLELERRDSLSLLEPVLGKLPHLQHLAAHVSMDRDYNGGKLVARDHVEAYRGQLVHRDPDHAPTGSCHTCASNVFQGWSTPGQCRKPRTPWNVPDLEQLCPHLSHLHLTLDLEHYNRAIVVDGQVTRLLPACLQQLSLTASGYGEGVWPPSSSLRHLPALQQLSLSRVQVEEGPGPGALAQDLAALQQLRLSRTWVAASDALVRHVPHKITSCGVMPSFTGGLVEVLSRAVHLTQLELSTGPGDTVFPGTADAVAALTGLQQLRLGYKWRSPWVKVITPVLEQVVGMATLRSLQLEWYVKHPSSLGAALVQCMQLTCLVIHGVCQTAVSACAAALQQLTGLQALTVPADLLQQQAGAWLAPLTALTRLCVKLGPLAQEGWLRRGRDMSWAMRCPQQAIPEPLLQAMAQQLLQQVQVWPASLQQVVLSAEVGRIRYPPICWQFTPAAQSSVQVSVWLEEEAGTAPGWARPFRPCPHLPGVWQLQGEVQDQDG